MTYHLWDVMYLVYQYYSTQKNIIVFTFLYPLFPQINIIFRRTARPIKDTEIKYN